MAPGSGRGSRRAVTFLALSLVFISTAVGVIVVPLLPHLAERYSASGLAIGLTLTIPGLVTVAVSLPVGAAVDSFGARRLCILSASLITVGTVLQGFAPSLWSFLAARGLFGIGWGMAWVVGPGLMLEQARATSGRAQLGVIAVASGAGFIVGPVLGAALYSTFGEAAPFLVCGAASALLLAGFVSVPEFAPLREGESAVGHASWIRAAARGPAVITGIVAMVCVGFSTSLMNLVVPLGLHADGANTAQIGLAFSVAAVLYVLGSATAVRFTAKLATIPAIGLGLGAIAISAAPAVCSVSALAIILTLMLHTPIRAGLASTTYSLLAIDDAGGDSGAAVGLLNMAYAAAAAMGPVVGGLLLETGSVQPAFASIMALAGCGSVAVWLVGRRARIRAQAASSAEAVCGL
jgi:predicted MFS family arabinose efflux permease